jgi:hypothetical protein
MSPLAQSSPGGAVCYLSASKAALHYFLPCDVAHSSLAISCSKVRDSESVLWCQEATWHRNQIALHSGSLPSLCWR